MTADSTGPVQKTGPSVVLPHIYKIGGWWRVKNEGKARPEGMRYDYRNAAILWTVEQNRKKIYGDSA